MTEGKTTKWAKKTKNGNVSEFRPKEQPAVKAKDAAKLGAANTPEPEQSEYVRPIMQDYYPTNEDGSLKEDGRKRVMLMVEADGVTFAPVIWFNTNVVEVSVIAAEAAKVMAMEVASAIVKREEAVGQELDMAVMTALKNAGLMDAKRDDGEGE